MNNKAKKRLIKAGCQRGFTLLELILGVVLAGIVGLFLFWMVIEDAKYKAIEHTRAKVREKTQLVVDLLSSDVRDLAGYENMSYDFNNDQLMFDRILYNDGSYQLFQVSWTIESLQGTGQNLWRLRRTVNRPGSIISTVILEPLSFARFNFYFIEPSVDPNTDKNSLEKISNNNSSAGLILSHLGPDDFRRLAYIEVELEVEVQSANARLSGMFGEHYKPYKLIKQVHPRNIDPFIKGLAFEHESMAIQGGDVAIDRAEYIVQGVVNVGVGAVQAAMSMLTSAMSMASGGSGAAMAPAMGGISDDAIGMLGKVVGEVAGPLGAMALKSNPDYVQGVVLYTQGEDDNGESAQWEAQFNFSLYATQDNWHPNWIVPSGFLAASFEEEGQGMDTGIMFKPVLQNPYLIQLGLPINTFIDEDRTASLDFQGKGPYPEDDWGKAYPFSTYFIPGQSDIYNPLPIEKGQSFDFQVLSPVGSESITAADVLAALWLSLNSLRGSYEDMLPVFKELKGLQEQIEKMANAMGQMSGGGG